MTIEEIKKRIEEIKAKAEEDYEVAHVLEDELYKHFIAYVAQDKDADIAEKAALVLTTGELDFTRWYA